MNSLQQGFQQKKNHDVNLPLNVTVLINSNSIEMATFNMNWKLLLFNYNLLRYIWGIISASVLQIKNNFKVSQVKPYSFLKDQESLLFIVPLWLLL